MFCSHCGKNLNDNEKVCEKCGEKTVHLNLKDSKDNDVKGEAFVSSGKNKKKAMLWMLIPICSYPVILMLYAILSFVSAEANLDEQGIIIIKLFTMILGFLGVVGIVMIIVGLIIGIVLLNKKDKKIDHYDSRSGNGSESVLPEELSKWNWGAAGLTWIWGLSNGVYLSLLMFVPYLNLIWWIFLGLKGNKWAWANSRWESVEEFKRVQDKWKPWGLAFFWIPIVIFVMLVLLNVLLNS